MTLLQFTKSVFDPSWFGPNDDSIAWNEWVMIVVFIIWASSYIYLLVGLRIQIRKVKSNISLTLLFISSIGLIIAGFLNTDPSIPNNTEEKRVCTPIKTHSNEKHVKYH